MDPLSISNKRRILEISAVILTAVGKFVFINFLNWRFPFITSAILLWTFYILYRNKTNPGILKYWGFRMDNFTSVLRKVLPFGILSIITFICIGIYQGTINVSWHIIPILILYPIWGIIQQFLLIALTAGNLQDLKGQQLDYKIIILISAALFALVHYPFLWLIGGTFALALFYGWIYLKERNIFVLGLFHGWIGGLYYYTVLDRDPFLEMFGKIFPSIH
ncbi:MAG TPA: CPBP family intramembrane glutamic endopeptidase [Saprospiraceae bacterium]|nr:CPBP family intramembrane glutamic endopeptidase [Saprospiraceae bacterium]